MLKTISIIGFLVLASVVNSKANDSERINQLEKKIHELENRLSKLESTMTDTSNAKEVGASSDGWKSVKNWRKLETNMGEDDVRRILGEPFRVDGGDVTLWHYQNRGSLTFIEGKLSQWMEPGR